MNTLVYLDLVYSNIINFTLIFTRIFTLFYTISIFRREMATIRVILSLAMVLSLYVLIICKPASINIDIMSVSYIIQSITQSFIGFVSGTIINIVFEVFVSTGQIISTQIGLSTASLFDPKYGMITSLTQFYLVVGIVIFLSMNGHLILIDTIVNSFTVLPLDKIPINYMGDIIVSYASIIFTGGVSMAMIIIAIILLTNICLAVMSKFAPQFNLFSVGINMSLIIGLICIFATFNIVTDKGAGYIGQSLENMNSYLHKLGKR